MTGHEKIPVIKVGSDTLAQYREYLDERRYDTRTRRMFISGARKVIAAFPSGVPLDEDLVVGLAERGGKTRVARKTRRYTTRRFYEFLDTEFARRESV